ncbi:MAG: hypothetical protein AMJ88_07945 [Anaerolineae bacterium SM23_ 63]|nr:MAG: hypothetical protein AMJ88_07945 [Anaerolineae bacterium SM23_ 63]HEY47319.1 hypothetical protein [Anaerolineae bacterium]
MNSENEILRFTEPGLSASASLGTIGGTEGPAQDDKPGRSPWHRSSLNVKLCWENELDCNGNG